MLGPGEAADWLIYRSAYGEAARLAEIAAFDHGFGRDFAARVGAEAEAIRAEVRRRVAIGTGSALVDEAVDDVLAGKPPRW